MSTNSLKTPCIGLCSTVYGDTVCRGCKRYDYEIIDWNSYTEEEKQTIYQRLDKLLQEVMSDKLIITSAVLLKEKLVKHNIRFENQQSPYYWALLLLAKGSRQISDMSAYGIKIRPPFDQQPLWELKEQIDVEYFALSSKHYPK